MNDWVCNTGVNFTMGSGGSGLTYNPHDGINAIFFAELSSPAGGVIPLAATVASVGICTNNQGHEVAEIFDIDMGINLTSGGYADNMSHYWDYSDINTTAGGEITLSGTVRHEFGHAVALEHVNNSQDLMYYMDLGGA